MSIDRIKNFNRKMSRPKYAGYIKRKKFATGGGTEHTQDVPINQAVNPVGGPGAGMTNTNTSGIGGLTQGLGLNAATANIQPGTNAAQLNNAYTGANNAINAQVGLTNTLAPQARTGVNAQNQVLQHQLDIANGAGPNPAMAQLSQTTGTNVANEAALLAGQRGSAANPGMAARNIGMAGAGTMQNSAGQAATLEAEQQIAANQNAANVAANQINQTQGATTNLNTAQQNEQNILQGANTANNNANVGMQSNINGVNATANNGALGFLSSGLGAALPAVSKMFGAKGGEVHPGKHKLDFIHKMAKMGMEHYDGGGIIDKVSDFISGDSSDTPTAQAAPSPSPNINQQDAKKVSDSFNGAMGFADGGSIQQNPLINGPVAAMPQMAVSNYTTPVEPSNLSIAPAPSVGSGSKGDNPLSGLGKTIGGALNNVGSTLWNGLSSMGSGAAAGATNAVGTGAEGMGTWAGADAVPLAEDATVAAAAHGGQIWDVHPSEHDRFLANHFQQYFSGGGKVPAMVSPGEVYLNPQQVEQVKQGADPLRVGQRVPGQAKVKGDSYQNDFVKADLDEGGVVVDRENVGNSKKARKFVLKSITKKHLKKPGKR